MVGQEQKSGMGCLPMYTITHLLRDASRKSRSRSSGAQNSRRLARAGCRPRCPDGAIDWPAVSYRGCCDEDAGGCSRIHLGVGPRLDGKGRNVEDPVHAARCPHARSRFQDEVDGQWPQLSKEVLTGQGVIGEASWVLIRQHPSARAGYGQAIDCSSEEQWLQRRQRCPLGVTTLRARGKTSLPSRKVVFGRHLFSCRGGSSRATIAAWLTHISNRISPPANPSQK